ncbi:MAG: HAD-IA family hydrolase [Gammaproteobacteria bacterium]
MSNNIKHVLFDLDGTLVDTAPDMATALNRLLVENRRAPLDFSTIRPVVSHGGAALVAMAFPDTDPAMLETRRQRFLALYAEQLQRESQLFPGMETVLTELARQQRHWGIVTNKPAWLAEPLIQAMIGLGKLPDSCACIVCGDQVDRPKPAADALLRACELTGWQAQECVYVGDAKRDIEAAHAAGMAGVVASYGYLASTDNPGDWTADAVINSPEELLGWLTASAVITASVS